MDGDLECEATTIAILINNLTISIKAHNVVVSSAGHICLVLDTGGLFDLKKSLMYDQTKALNKIGLFHSISCNLYHN